MAVVLAHPELTYLAAYLGRLRNWDERSAVRMQVRGGVVGLYGSLPMEALALVVVPLAQSAAGTDLDGFDRTVSAGRLRDVIGNPGDDATAVRELRIPDEIAGPASLADLPPRSGWYPGESALARDVSEVLATLPLAEPVRDTGLVVAYHSACSMQHGQKITRQPKELLAKAGFVVREPREGHLCCGSAGTYNILQPEISAKLRDRKVNNIEATGAEIVATGNIGCITQIASAAKMPVVHTVQLLDWAYGGEKPAEAAGAAAITST